jgi:hypothetical protein
MANSAQEKNEPKKINFDLSAVAIFCLEQINQMQFSYTGNYLSCMDNIYLI